MFNNKEQEELEYDRKKKTELSKYLLTASASDYATSVGKNLDYFEFRSVDSLWERADNLESVIFAMKNGLYLLFLAV